MKDNNYATYYYDKESGPGFGKLGEPDLAIIYKSSANFLFNNF